MTTLQAHTPEDRAALRSILTRLSKPKRKKRSKYGNKRVYLDGYKFDSKAEANHYLVLKEKLERGEIKNLQCQPKYPLFAHGPQGQQLKVCEYWADFEYLDVRTGTKTIVDVKGVRTVEYRIKKKIFEANYGVEITEVKA